MPWTRDWRRWIEARDGVSTRFAVVPYNLDTTFVVDYKQRMWRRIIYMMVLFTYNKPTLKLMTRTPSSVILELIRGNLAFD
jgi:hypothetical protein